MLRNQFWTQLSTAQRVALLLDYDGTLAPFRVQRDQAVPYPGVRERLKTIRDETATRLIIISGRAIDDLLPLLGLEPSPEVWGCHGWERLTAEGQRVPVALPQEAQEGLDEAWNWVESEELTTSSETKPASLAIHWRGHLPEEIEALRTRVVRAWQPLATAHRLEIHEFNGGLELRCPGRTKGTAVETILTELDPDVPLAFLGDDLTDEDGFKAIKGRGLGVLVSEEARQSQADMRIVPPSGLLDFLDEWHNNAPRRKS